MSNSPTIPDGPDVAPGNAPADPLAALAALFEQHNAEYSRFEAITAPRHQCPDICAFLMLADLVPTIGRDIVSAAEHDTIYLAVDCEALARAVTSDQVRDLARCGVMFDADFPSLTMYV